MALEMSNELHRNISNTINSQLSMFCDPAGKILLKNHAAKRKFETCFWISNKKCKCKNAVNKQILMKC